MVCMAEGGKESTVYRYGHSLNLQHQLIVCALRLQWQPHQLHGYARPFEPWAVV